MLYPSFMVGLDLFNDLLLIVLWCMIVLRLKVYTSPQAIKIPRMFEITPKQRHTHDSFDYGRDLDWDKIPVSGSHWWQKSEGDSEQTYSTNQLEAYNWHSSTSNSNPYR
jgi:hypothetical protein